MFIELLIAFHLSIRPNFIFLLEDIEIPFDQEYPVGKVVATLIHKGIFHVPQEGTNKQLNSL